MEAATALSNTISDLLFIGGLTIWGCIAARAYFRKPILCREPRRPVPWDGWDLILIFGTLLVGEQFAFYFGFKWSGVPLPRTPSELGSTGALIMLIASAAARVVTLLLAIALLVGRKGSTASDLGFNARQFPRDVMIGTIGFLAIAYPVYAVQYLLTLIIPYEHPLIDVVQKQPPSGTLWMAGISAIVVAPLVEEFLFRVLLQGWLEKVEISMLELREQEWGQAMNAAVPIGLGGAPLGTAPIFIASFIFGLIHVGQGAAPIPLFLLALLLGFLYQRTHRLAPSVIAHMLLNAITMAMVFAQPNPA